jgi:hypothetical protein
MGMVLRLLWALIPISNRNIVSVYVVTIKQKILNVLPCTPAVFYLPAPSIHLTLFPFENGIREEEGQRVFSSACIIFGERIR